MSHCTHLIPTRRDTRLLHVALAIILTTAVFLLPACSSEGGDDNAAAPPPKGVVIGAAGGTASSTDGKASVTIPPGALASDQTITVDPVSPLPAGAIAAYDFGPDSLQFTQPVTVTIAYDEANLPAGASEADLLLRTLQNGLWAATTATENSSADTNQNTVAAQTTHFTTFGVIPLLLLNTPTVSLASSPSSGPAPLTVTLTATASDPDGGPIVSYEWDFESNGVDQTTTVDTTSHSYSVGSFTAKVKVTDDEGQTAEATASVSVGTTNPTVSLGAVPSSGAPPLLVTFTATASDPDGGSITKYEWDMDGNGTFDQDTGTINTASQIYIVPGIFTGPTAARVRVTDDEGQTAEATVAVTVTLPPPPPPPIPNPIVSLSAVPSSGAAPLTVNFSATASDPDGGSIVSYEWDFTNDGVFDQTTTAPTASNIYNTAGLFTARVKVTDDEGQTAEATTTITVGVTPSGVTRLSNMGQATVTVVPSLSSGCNPSSVISPEGATEWTSGNSISCTGAMGLGTASTSFRETYNGGNLVAATASGSVSFTAIDTTVLAAECSMSEYELTFLVAAPTSLSINAQIIGNGANSSHVQLCCSSLVGGPLLLIDDTSGGGVNQTFTLAPQTWTFLILVQACESQTAAGRVHTGGDGFQLDLTFGP